MVTVNMTFKISKFELVRCEKWMRENLDVIDFNNLVNTDKMWEKNSHFKKLVKSKKDLNLEIDRYINEHNHKYNDIQD